MQTKKEFTMNLKEAVKGLIGEGYRVEISRTAKVNTGTLHTLIIFNSENKVSPSFYIEDLYKDYKQGKSTINEIAEDIVYVYHSDTGLPINNKLEAYFNDSGWVKDKLILRLVNSNKNRELLNSSIYMDFHGLSLVLYVMVANDGEGFCEARVTTKMCEHFGWDEKDILNYALENTANLLPYKESPLHELLQKMINCTDMQGMDIPEDLGITVLTNDRGINGAAAAFYPGVLKKIAEKHGTSLFLLPSSIHEFIILEDNGIDNPEELAEMVREVNSYAVPPEDILSDDVYYYGRISGALSVFHNGELTKIAMP